MCRSKDCLFKRLPLTSLLHIVGFEGGVMLDNAGRHQPDHPSEMPVPPLRYPAFSLEFARLIHRGINAGKGNELLVRGIVSDAPYLGKKCGCCTFVDPVD